MPFLYLPDAVSLTLLIIGLSLLRRSAMAHCRQEMHRLRLEVLLYWTAEGLSTGHPAYGNLCGRINAAAELLEKVSPARLFFIARFCKRTSSSVWSPLLPDCTRRLEEWIQSIDDQRTQKRLRRVQLEFDISLGMFFLLGSVSGWMVTSAILLKLIRRMLSHRSADRTDWAFDLMEKIFSRLGRRTLQLALISNAYPDHK